MEKRLTVKARNSELKEIIDSMDIEEVETIYNTMQSYYGDFFYTFGLVELGSAAGKTAFLLTEQVNEPERAAFLIACDILYSIPLFLAAIKRGEFKADNERLNEIAKEKFGVSYNELSLRTRTGLYVNSRKRIKKEKKESKVKTR